MITIELPIKDILDMTRVLYNAGRKILAIKMIRQALDISLLEAKGLAEYVAQDRCH